MTIRYDEAYYLWGSNSGDRWGRVAPSSLRFRTPSEGEVVLRRYLRLYPHWDFVIARVGDDGNMARDAVPHTPEDAAVLGLRSTAS